MVAMYHRVGSRPHACMRTLQLLGGHLQLRGRRGTSSEKHTTEQEYFLARLRHARCEEHRRAPHVTIHTHCCHKTAPRVQAREGWATQQDLLLHWNTSSSCKRIGKFSTTVHNQS